MGRTLKGRYVWHSLYSVLKVSVHLGRDLAVPAPQVPWKGAELLFEFIESHWAYSSVGLERTPDKREVGSSNLPRPTTYR